jgi:hypothetical protein
MDTVVETQGSLIVNNVESRQVIACLFFSALDEFKLKRIKDR